jgi:CoA:oxalate CoA-transferase
MVKALEDIKVLDFTRIVAGPYCTMLLRDLGAEVIKIEQPGGGDAQRNLVPLTQGSESGFFIAINWGKKSITLNLATEKGRDICRQLVKKSDVVVENFAPGVMDKMGLSYDELSKLNPGLIYASISGFGHTGPRSLEPAFDIVVQAQGGFTYINGFPGPPVKIGLAIADFLGGIYASVAILGALHYREITGEGQMVDMSMQDCVWALAGAQYGPTYFLSKKIPEQLGNTLLGQAPFNIYKAKEDYVVITVGTKREWDNLLKIMGKEDLIEDESLFTGAGRYEKRKQIDAMVEEWTKTKSVQEIVTALRDVRIPCSPVPTFDQIVNDPQLKSRNMIAEVDQIVSGKVKVPGSVFKLSKTPGGVDHSAPFLGEHNYEVYCGILGYTEEEVRAFTDQCII